MYFAINNFLKFTDIHKKYFSSNKIVINFLITKYFNSIQIHPRPKILHASHKKFPSLKTKNEKI